MIDRKWWTRQLPLEDHRDVFARIGFRFIWATAPYFVLTYVLRIGAFGGRPEGAIQHFLSVFVFVVPILGGALDWWRLSHRTPREH